MALHILQQAQDKINEAKDIIERLIPQYNILGLKRTEFLEGVTDLIKTLSEIHSKGGSNPDIPIEGVYKLLYHDYKKVCEEKKELKKDIISLMEEKGMDKDTAALQLRLIHIAHAFASIGIKVFCRVGNGENPQALAVIQH